MAQEEMLYIRGQRKGDPKTREVAGGGMAGLRSTGKKSREGIPYANLGRMTVRTKRRKRATRS